MEPKPTYTTPPTAKRAAARTASVILPLDVIHVVEELLRARNRGHDEVLVRLKTWRVEVDDSA